jgi:tRNA modification GTPase
MAADTIFALSSGAPPAAIAIIRVSGPAARDVVAKMAGSVPEARRASLMQLSNPADGSLLDQAITLYFPGPDTVTGEDLAEFHVHGGRAVVQAVLSALSGIDGLRAAEAGEFTHRAFDNGRIDLNAADGLADLLTAETEWQRRAAMQMYSGVFGVQIEEWRHRLLELSALTEAELDFSDEDDVGDQNARAISDGCLALQQSIATLLDMPSAEKLRDGLRIVLGGPPNSGKSSLFNILVGRDAAIVSDIAGTTRDVIEAPMAWDGIPLLLIDTAGVREDSVDSIEQIGILRAISAFDAADIILWLGPQDEGPEHSNLIEVAAMADRDDQAKKLQPAIAVSARTGSGIGVLKHVILDQARNLLPPQDSFSINTRQRGWLGQAAEHLQSAGDAQDWLIVGEELRSARLALDALTGRTHTEDLLDTIFGRFCVGK